MCAESIRVMHPLFQAEEDGSIPISALRAKDLTIDRIPFEMAKDLNRRWHSRLPRLGGKFDCLCFGANYAGIVYAVGIWSHPVARLLPQDTWLELRRLSTASDAPRNTCSRMLRIMEMIVRRDRPEVTTLVSYQDTEVHTGGIYRAAGWQENTPVHSETKWVMPNRYRPPAQSEAVKVRWVKHLDSPAPRSTS